MTTTTRNLMITHPDCTYSNVHGLVVMAKAWSNTLQTSRSLDLLMPIALCDNQSSMNRLVRKVIGDSWSIVSYEKTNHPF